MYELTKPIPENIESLLERLADKDDKVRREARKSLIIIGKPAVAALSEVLHSSKVYKARWEAAKALGEIGDPNSIPSLVAALQDHETDVAWLAAEALKDFRKAAWPELLSAIIREGADSATLRHGAHHIFGKH